VHLWTNLLIYWVRASSSLTFSWDFISTSYKSLAQTSAKAKISTKIDPGFESIVWINPDSYPNVCRIAPKMLWIHYRVTVSHFAECRENRPVSAKSSILQWWGKWKSDPGSVSDHHQLLPIVRPDYNTKFQWNRQNNFEVILHTRRMTDRRNDMGHNLHLGGGNIIKPRNTLYARNRRLIFALPCRIACICRLVAADGPSGVSSQCSVDVKYRVITSNATHELNNRRRKLHGAVNADTWIICSA